LDAVNLNIQSVQIDNTQQRFDYDGEQLHIQLNSPSQVGKPVMIAIAYSVENPSVAFTSLPRINTTPTNSSLDSGRRRRLRFGSVDYQANWLLEIRVRVPKPFIAISNGQLIHTQEDRDYKIYWSQEQVHPTYLMTLVVGDFAEIQDVVARQT